MAVKNAIIRQPIKQTVFIVTLLFIITYVTSWRLSLDGWNILVLIQEKIITCVKSSSFKIRELQLSSQKHSSVVAPICLCQVVQPFHQQNVLISHTILLRHQKRIDILEALEFRLVYFFDHFPKRN